MTAKADWEDYAHGPHTVRLPIENGWLYLVSPSHCEPCLAFVPDTSVVSKRDELLVRQS